MANKPSDSNRKNAYLKYTGLAFQIVGSLLVGLWIGGWVDEKFSINPPIITALLPIFLFFAVIFKLYKDLEKK